MALKDDWYRDWQGLLKANQALESALAAVHEGGEKAGEAMTTPKLSHAIMSNLRRFGHIGRHNAVSRHALQVEMRINVPDRTFRRAYTADACPVAVCDDGLFIPAHWHEVQDYLRYYGAHVRPELLKARAAVMTLAYHELMTRDTGPLFQQGEVRI